MLHFSFANFVIIIIIVIVFVWMSCPVLSCPVPGVSIWNTYFQIGNHQHHDRTKSKATVTLLENIDILMLKTCTSDFFRTEIVPMICNAFDSSTPQIQVCILILFFSHGVLFLSSYMYNDIDLHFTILFITHW